MECNAFQSKLSRNIKKITRDAALSTEIEKFEGTWNEKPEMALIFSIKEFSLQLWLYVDGAQIHGEKIDHRYEKEDYDDLDQLSEAFLEKLKKVLRKLILLSGVSLSRQERQKNNEIEDEREVFNCILIDFTGEPLEHLKDDVSIVGNFGITSEDAGLLSEILSKEFNVDWTRFDLNFYFDQEGVPFQKVRRLINGGFFRDWRSGQLKANREKRRKFTVGHLWQVCERGKWFDPE